MARMVRRRASDDKQAEDQRWSVDVIHRAIGTPWDPIGRKLAVDRGSYRAASDLRAAPASGDLLSRLVDDQLIKEGRDRGRCMSRSWRSEETEAGGGAIDRAVFKHLR
eukprot:1012563-Amphidinium_carterae.5